MKAFFVVCCILIIPAIYAVGFLITLLCFLAFSHIVLNISGPRRPDSGDENHRWMPGLTDQPKQYQTEHKSQKLEPGKDYHSLSLIAGLRPLHEALHWTVRDHQALRRRQ